MALVKKLTKIGNSYGVILPAEILKIAGIEPEDECELEVEKDGVLLRPYRKGRSHDQKVMKAMARFMKKYRDDLKKLAS